MNWLTDQRRPWDGKQWAIAASTFAGTSTVLSLYGWKALVITIIWVAVNGCIAFAQGMDV
ncbi:hypothetical protein PROPHIGD91-2_71 [Mycobacterium phage prophiGD91-2]|uniref:hypothetical protein n=1 Tax=Mycobacteroides abscessus TaxID=36809 RepID=UPI0019CFB0CD|nr:hypothetical protein [Mycobacteroides abscessus]QSM03924.1 hypothetical protein PROPHIGD91-2_71 [Mycobacterium phage prophiGD91-2]QSM90527.1 hypothetical protein I3U44_07610 [Mycobacteroides abscessus subsp. bolletii]QSM90811.1 hypothetical protein I3U44_09245 [Mycobacteroides abscessus subsp. bolletii]